MKTKINIIYAFVDINKDEDEAFREIFNIINYAFNNEDVSSITARSFDLIPEVNGRLVKIFRSKNYHVSDKMHSIIIERRQ